MLLGGSTQTYGWNAVTFPAHTASTLAVLALTVCEGGQGLSRFEQRKRCLSG